MMKRVCFILIFLFVVLLPVRAQLFELDTLPQFDFIRYDLNKLSVKDTSTLGAFFDKMWTFESTQKGKVKILHIGDSHIQAGYFSGKVRECLHKGLGCGTRERGFVFPFGLAHTNGPMNYAAKYSGNWQGFKSASNNVYADWGISGITAATKDDSTTLKIYSNNHTFDAYTFKKVKFFYQDENNAFDIQLKTDRTDSIYSAFDEYGCYKVFSFPTSVDTLYFTFIKDSMDTESELSIQGIELQSDYPGITYSEVGVNGAKVKSFLRCNDFNSQLATLNPDLVVISLGVNDAYNLNFDPEVFYNHYDSLLRMVKTTLPFANVLLTTPGDGKRHKKTPLRENLYIRNVILKLAKNYNAAVWDFFKIMGGLTSVNKWHEADLVSFDFLHFNERGYHLQGELLYTALASSYNQYTHPRRVRPLIIRDGVNYENFFTNIFLYNSNDPMFFSHYLFWTFFSIFFLFYALLYRKKYLRSLYLFIISLFFYYKAGGVYFVLLIVSTIFDFFIGKKIFKSQGSIHRKQWLILSVTLNLLLLFFFKYSIFFIGLVNSILGTHLEVFNVFAGLGNLFSQGSFDIHEIILPVGISFYTFQTISYTVDLYRKKLKPVDNIIDFGFYVSFFPQLVAGPIVRASEFIPQLKQEYKLSYQTFSRAGLLIIGGLFKKMVISDYISSNFVDRVFEAPLKYSGFENLLGAYGYAIQIYCDFSAYSDIAIGLALLMGFKLPQNFNQPYLSTSITDFWRRWHMSLSNWLKDYLYVPLGGNRKGKIRTYINLFITMLLGGLWHGANIKFVIWGGLHGLALGIHKFSKSLIPSHSNKPRIFMKLIGWLITFHFVVFCWLFFRAPDYETISLMLAQIGTNFGLEHAFEYLFAPDYSPIFLLMLMGFLLHLIPDKYELKIQHVFANRWWPALGITAILMVVVIYQFKSSEIQPFIYFQF